MLAVLSLSTAAYTAPLARAPRASISMSARDMIGVSAPMGFFDPLGFSKDADKVPYLREAELKHGRIAMFAVLGWLTTASGFHPLLDGLKIAGGATPLADAAAMSPAVWVQILSFIGAVESFTYLIKKDSAYKPGDLLGASQYMDADDRGWQRFQLAELNNGRLAMLGIMGLIAESAIFNHALIGLGY